MMPAAMEEGAGGNFGAIGMTKCRVCAKETQERGDDINRKWNGRNGLT